MLAHSLTTTTAILGSNRVVANILALPLKGAGYATMIFERSPTNLVGEPAPNGEG